MEDRVLTIFAEEIAVRISKKVISALQKIPHTHSGDDSELINAWDEICVQVQQEYSIMWDAYDYTARSIAISLVEKLKWHERIALWFQTTEGSDWLYHDEHTREREPPVFVDDISP
jgi:hypothetical protein